MPAPTESPALMVCNAFLISATKETVVTTFMFMFAAVKVSKKEKSRFRLLWNNRGKDTDRNTESVFPCKRNLLRSYSPSAVLKINVFITSCKRNIAAQRTILHWAELRLCFYSVFRNRNKPLPSGTGSMVCSLIHIYINI